MSKSWNPACLWVLFFLTLNVFLSGCKSFSERGAKGVGTLPPASPNETRFSSYQPAHPYQQLTKGLLGRKLFAAPPDAGAGVEIHDFLVGPRQRSDKYSLPAAAIFQVKSGSGLLSLGEKPQKIEAGTVATVPPAQPFAIENQTDIPIAIRVSILGSK